MNVLEGELDDAKAAALLAAQAALAEYKLETESQTSVENRWQLLEKLSSVTDKFVSTGLMVGVLVAAVAIRLGTAVEDYTNILKEKGYLENARMVKTTSYIIPAIAIQYSTANDLPINPLAAGFLTFAAEGLAAVALRVVAIHHLDQRGG